MKKGQIWVETVIYTMIALALMALVLAFVNPRLKENRDKIIAEQTIASLNDFDIKIREAMQTPGNQRVTYFMIKRGELKINPAEDEITFTIKGMKKPFSEPGIIIRINNVFINTTKMQKDYTSIFKITYKNFADITYSQDNIEPRVFDPAPTAYKFVIYNSGRLQSEEFDVIRISELSG